MQNNTNGLNEILTLLDNLPEGSSGNPTQDFFVDSNGIHSIALDGTLTNLHLGEMTGGLYDSAFMEFCRTTIFKMGGVNSGGEIDTDNPGRQGARGRFLFGNYNITTAYLAYLDNVTGGTKVDSMIVECIGGPQTTAAECTMIADVYTVDAKHYHLQICCKYEGYFTDGWQLVSYGDSSDSGNYASVDTDNTFIEENDFQGNVLLSGPVADYGGEYGTEGQILSSTGDGVKWIDAPSGSGGGGGLTLYSTWTGTINESGYDMSAEPNVNDTYILEVTYEYEDGGMTRGRCLFKAYNFMGAEDWGCIKFRDLHTAEYFIGNYIWSKSLGAPSPQGIYYEGDPIPDKWHLVAINLYKLN